MKGMLFIGCSFTQGLALWYYSNLKGLVQQKRVQDKFNNAFVASKIPHAWLLYIQTCRFPRLVANHFNTYEIVANLPSGSQDTSVDLLDIIINPDSFHEHSNWVIYNCNDIIEPTDISHVILQFTEVTRSTFELNDTMFDWNDTEKLTRFLGVKGPSLDKILNYALKYDIKKVRTRLEKLESYGINTYILTWPKNFVTYIQNDVFLRDRFITFQYSDKVYNSIEELHDLPRANLQISKDFSYFQFPPADCHPSLSCHKLIANNIIKYIEENEKI